jgi:hypothetical protein
VYAALIGKTMDITDPEHPQFDVKRAVALFLLENPEMPKPEIVEHIRRDFGQSEPMALAQDLAALAPTSVGLSLDAMLEAVAAVYLRHGNTHMLDDEPAEQAALTM